MKTKTIGPMKLDGFGYWRLNPASLLCGDTLRKRFNIPIAANQLWVTLTKHRPKHRDAIRVRYTAYCHVRLDRGTALHYIVAGMRIEAADFGDDFYATIYYK